MDLQNINSGNRQPANKAELMAAYSKLRASQSTDNRQSIVNAMFGTSTKNTASSTVEIPSIQTNTATAVQTTAAANKAAAETAAPTNTVPAGNTLKNTGRTETTIVNAPGNKGNTITGPEGFASRDNKITVNGAKNTVDLSGTAPAGVSAATYAATGGADANRNKVSVTGNENQVRSTGRMQKDNTVNINGNNNQVNLGNQVDKANINLAGNNVEVNIGGDNILSRNQDKWNINVNANDLSIKIENGQATVQGKNGNDAYNIEIDNEKRTVTVTAKAPASPVNELGGTQSPENMANG